MLGNDPNDFTLYSFSVVTIGSILGGVAYARINPCIECVPSLLMTLGYSYSNYLPYKYEFVIPGTIFIELYTELLHSTRDLKEGLRFGIAFSIATLVYDFVTIPLYIKYQQSTDASQRDQESIETYEQGDQCPLLGVFEEDQCPI